ncbi:7TM diverse intracellular signaling domain-containing protein [Bacillus sp. CGMCC 1.16607]|uniref:7TM diverse intracellular signaling domain-containing protein n=1 Tax=Bacillus sp. CGMCC 1.16607 TaxID=3351842 RepID=UPI00363F5FA8
MKRKLVIVFIFLLIVMFYSKNCFATTPFVLTNKTTEIKPNQVLFLEDKNGTFTLDEVVSKYKDKFHATTTNVPSFGYTSSVYWLSFTVRNQSTKKDWMLEIDSPPLDYLSLYLPNDNGEFTEIKSGDLYPFSQREVQARSFVFDLHVNQGEEKTYFIRAETEGAMKIPISVWDEHAFFSHNEKQTAIHFVYYGIVLVMAIYNFFLFIFLRNKSYVYYSLFSFSFMFIPMTNLGDAYQWLWPNQPWWNNRSIVFFLALSALLSCVFVMKFLSTKEMLPRIHKILKVFIVVQLITIAILLLWSYPIALNIVFVTSVLHGPLFLFIGIASWRRKYFLAKYFLLAWVVFLIANSISMLNDAGVIPDSFLTEYILFLGSSSELILFSLGLSSQVDRIRREKEQLNLEMEDTQREIVFTMGEVIEARSKETSNHVKRVAEYSAIIAEAIGISREEVEKLKVASPMHDIGKVGIPDSILHKPGKLSLEEFAVIKSHTTIGYDMLKHSTRDILKLAAIIAHQHHEKFNGTGYPQGLKGEEINIYARITAIADVFDALGSSRSYKNAWDLNAILSLFDEEKGKHFDPVLIDTFLENLDKILAVKEQFPD